MKYFLTILGGFMFATLVVQPLVATGQSDGQFSGAEEDVPYSSARIFSKLVAATGADPNADWTQSFGPENEEDIGKNLYLMIYEKTIDAPQREAFNETAETYGMTTPDMIRVLHNDYTTIAQQKPGLRQEELQFKLAEIQQKYREELELRELEANIQASTQPSEIFANGDVADSGFDLINDLTLIEELLFLKTQPIDIGKSYVNPDGSGTLVATGQVGGTAESVAPANETRVPVNSSGDSLTVEESASGSAPGMDQGGNTGTGATGSGTTDATDDGTVNPAFCLLENPYDDALATFDSKKETDANYKDASQTPGNSGAAGGAGGTPTAPNPGNGSGGTGGVGTTGSALTDGSFLPQRAVPPTPPVAAAVADEWRLPAQCDDVFCLTVNAVMKPATSSFANADNCIACHSEKINDVLKTVITHTLIPSKAPGNLGESAQCKKAVSSLFGTTSMNLYTIAMPIQTPLNDDLMFGTSLEEDWRKYCEDTAYFPFDLCKPPADSVANSTYSNPPSLLDRASKEAIVESPDEATYESVNARTRDTLTSYINSSSQAASTNILEKTADETTRFSSPILTEMDQMNRYFVNIREIIHSLHERVDGIAGKQACSDLKNKKECE